MTKNSMQYAGLLLFVLAGASMAALSAGCIQQPGPIPQDPFPGTWQYWGNIGEYNATIVFTFLENRTGRYDLAVMESDPPSLQSMEFSWESKDDQLFLGTSSEQQHLVILYHPGTDTVVVNADSESGIFVNGDFIPGPFTWEFSRVVREKP